MGAGQVQGGLSLRQWAILWCKGVTGAVWAGKKGAPVWRSWARLGKLGKFHKDPAPFLTNPRFDPRPTRARLHTCPSFCHSKGSMEFHAHLVPNARSTETPFFTTTHDRILDFIFFKKSFERTPDRRLLLRPILNAFSSLRHSD